MTKFRLPSGHSCGYEKYAKKKQLNSLAFNQNVLSINRKTQLDDSDGVPIATCDAKDFDKVAIELPSCYNPPTMKTFLTDDGRKKHTICDIKFDDKTIQFIAVDGNYMTESQYSNPDYVIKAVNSGRLKPISFSSNAKISASDMTKLDAYSGSIFYCLFLFEVLNRIGLIDDEMVFLSVVNVNLANAFWNGYYMTYGNGKEPDTPPFGPLTSLDVIGHEAGHAIIESLGGLEYRGESGALNESIADVLGINLEKYYSIRTAKIHQLLRPSVTSCSVQNDMNDWQIGELVTNGGLRSMSNPNSHEQPDTYGGIYWINPNTSTDNGGVHTNSGVTNFAYYVAVTASKGTNNFNVSYEVKKSFPMFKLTKLIYKSLRGGEEYVKINGSCNFHDFANCILKNSAPFLRNFDLSSQLMETLKESFVACGLKQRDPTLDPVPDPSNPPSPPSPFSSHRPLSSPTPSAGILMTREVSSFPPFMSTIAKDQNLPVSAPAVSSSSSPHGTSSTSLSMPVPPCPPPLSSSDNTSSTELMSINFSNFNLAQDGCIKVSTRCHIIAGALAVPSHHYFSILIKRETKTPTILTIQLLLQNERSPVYLKLRDGEVDITINPNPFNSSCFYEVSRKLPWSSPDDTATMEIIAGAGHLIPVYFSKLTVKEEPILVK